MKEKIKTNLDEEEIILAPPTEFFDEAKTITDRTKNEPKYKFLIKYDQTQREMLNSVMEAMECKIKKEFDSDGSMVVCVNMEQLKLLKTLNCVEWVQAYPTYEMRRSADPEFFAAKEQEIAEASAQGEESTVASATAEVATSSSAEPTVMSLEAAEPAVAAVASTDLNDPISLGMSNSITMTLNMTKTGCICCPEDEKWYHFQAPTNGTYTFYATGNLDTVGTLYDIYQNQVATNNNAAGFNNFRIVVDMAAGQNYYLRVTGFGNHTGVFYVHVTDKVLPSYITVSPQTVKLNVGATQQLTASVFPENAQHNGIYFFSSNKKVATVDSATGLVTAVGKGVAEIEVWDWQEQCAPGICTVYVDCAPVEKITFDCNEKIIRIGDSEYIYETIEPDNAFDKSVEWHSSNYNIVDVNNSGLVTGLSLGTATITATTVDGGHVAECEVTVDDRPKAIIQEDDEGVYNFFKVTFPESEGGLVWKSVGEDLSELNPTLYPYHYARYNSNATQEFSYNQLAFLYRLDPLGVAHYAKRHWIGDSNYLTKKDNLYHAIFGRQDLELGRFYFRLVNEQIVYINDITVNREDVFSNAEILFGFHKIFDWANFGSDILEYIFTSLPVFDKITAGVEMHEALYFSRGVTNVDYATGFVANYIDGEMQSEIENAMVSTVGSFAFKAIIWVLRLIKTAAQSALESFMPPNQNDMIIYSKMNEQDLYCPVFYINGRSVSMQKFADLTN